MLYILRHLIFILLFVCASCTPIGTREPAAGEPASDPVASGIRALTESHARVVWCQDIGDGSDTFAQGQGFRLMGYDTEDGKGERVILPGPSNFSRPMITPHGDRVIFSRRSEAKVFIVNWDGSGLAELGSGLAVSAWADPHDGTEWVYAGTMIGESQTVRDLRRFRIDNPAVEEIVWNKTPIEADNVQLSADGRYASGAFPWPDCGFAEFPNVGWKSCGRGCWPSFAPDDSGLLWIFDGSHRNLTMFASGGEERWTLNINNAPGIDGHEVYHPRWSNHVRFMVMTGPYTVGASANRIRGGGADVEIYIGEFAGDFRFMKRWARVTHNHNADFYPDLWVKKKNDSIAPSVAVPSILARPIRHSSWPGDVLGLVFLWENRSSDNEIRDATEGVSLFCRVEPAGLARYGRYFDMLLLPGGNFIAESGSDLLLKGCVESGRLGIEALVTPRGAASGFARIMSLGTESNEFNFVIGQRDDRLVFQLLLSEDTGAAGSVGERDLGALVPGKANHVIVSYRPGQLSCFINGEVTFARDDVQGDFGNWSSGPLVLGDEGENGWAGALERVALYARPIEEDEAARKFASCSELIGGRTVPSRFVVDAVLKEASGIPLPGSILPYRRALVVNTYEIDKVLEGESPEKRLLAAHWAILDGKILDKAERSVGTVYRMTIEPFDERPELDGERLVMDSDDFTLPMYYDLDE